MNRKSLHTLWGHMRQKYGVYLRLLESIPADRFNDHPVEGMRTPTQMVAHLSGGIVRDIAEGVASGAITPDEAGEEAVAMSLTSKGDAVNFARTCWDRADAAIATTGDAELAADVENPWGVPLTGTLAIVVLNDEFLHHRGQLYAYARACGAEPPFMWSFADNPEGFRPHG
jgi:uncharacterized damage-inducible protein DinB